MLEPEPRSHQAQVNREGLGTYTVTTGEQDMQEHSARTTGSPHRVAPTQCPTRLLVPAQARLLQWDPWGPGEFSLQTERRQARADERSESVLLMLSWLETYSQGAAAEGL